MDLLSLVKKSRSYRRFDETYAVASETLRGLIRLAQYSPTGNNQQPLKFWLSNSVEMNAIIFPHLAWAGSLKAWGGPKEGERPTAYVIILGDTEIKENFGVDYGIAAQSIMLGAADQGLGGCMIASVQRHALREKLGIPERYEILLVLALGKPAETVLTEPIEVSGGVRYYRDSDGVHHVPKRGLEDLIVRDV
jgi:nitroreductase